MRRIRAIGAAALILTALALGSAPAAASPASVAALQAALKSLGLYSGYVDGVKGPLTRRGVRAFQHRQGLATDGIAGPRTHKALGWRGRPALGSRPMSPGNRGWDVAALQFLLQRAGHGPGRADGLFGPLTESAVHRAQEAAGVAVDGVAGPVTIQALRSGGGGDSTASDGPGGPVRFLRPVVGPIADGFGAAREAGRLHQGLDFPVGYGTRVGAAGVGTTIFAGYNYNGYGNLVVVQHRLGYTTWYAHLSKITTWVGEQVVGGTRLGYVGSTGYSTGPHLHFETRRYDTPFDPMIRLLPYAGAASATKGAAADRQAGIPGGEGSGGTRADRAPRNAGDQCAHPRRAARRAPTGSDWIARERLCAKRR